MTENTLTLMYEGNNWNGSTTNNEGKLLCEPFVILYSAVDKNSWDDFLHSGVFIPCKLWVDTDIFIGKNCFPFKNRRIYKFTFSGKLQKGRSWSNQSFRVEGNFSIEEINSLNFNPNKSWEEISMLKEKISRWNDKHISSEEEVSRLKRELRELTSKKNDLERDRDDWKTKFRNENSKYEDYKKKYEKAIKDLGDERTNCANRIAEIKLQNEREKSVSQVENTELKKQLEDTKNELGLVRVAKDNQEIALISKIDQKQLLLEAVRQSLADLQVEKEREKANEMMQKINRAYEILGDEEKKRRYDLGETDFSSYENDYRKSAWEEKEEKLKKQEELLEKLMKGTEEYMRILEALWLLNARYLDRDDTAADIDMIAIFGIPKVFDKDLEPKFSYLWEPYKSWRDKVWKMPITLSMKDNINKSEELKQFKEQMIKAVEETRIILQNKQKNEEEEETNSRIKKARTEEIEEIEGLLKRKGIKAQDLEEKYRNYQEQINNLDEVWKIHDFRDDVIENIWKLVKEGEGISENNSSSFEEQPDKRNEGQIPSKFSDNSNKNDNNQKVNYGNLTREELINAVNQKDLENVSLKEIISALEKKVEELEEQIRKLKGENPQTSEIQQQIRKREAQLKEAKDSLAKINNSNTEKTKAGSRINNKYNNSFPIGWVIGGGALIMVGLIAVFIKKNKLRNRSTANN